MRSAAYQKTSARRLRRALILAATLCGAATQVAASFLPIFTKSFDPSAIGPGSVSMLTFTIDNTAGPGATDLAFTDVLPGGMTLAAPAIVSNSCGGTLTAPAGSDTITLSGGQVGSGAVCTIVVNVTAVAVDASDTTYMNVSGDLTSSAGNSGSAAADLMVLVGLPGFSKEFFPATVAFGGRSTLTFTIDNSLGAAIGNLDFTDTLPVGMVVAGPSNATTDCVNPNPFFPTTLSAVPGSSVITLDADGSLPTFPLLAAGANCTVSVDVIGGAVGLLGNVSDNLLVDFELAGKAAAVLEVTGIEDPLLLAKEFTDDPVTPGGTVTLEFTASNRSRTETATSIAFADDLGATLMGLSATLPPSPDPPCGLGSSLAFVGGVLSLSGGELPPEGSCTFSVELTVPAAATPGSYTNTTGPITGDVGGAPASGDPAGDLLFVVAPPDVFLTKVFDDPAGAGGPVTLEFTIKNNAASPLTDIEFTDDLETALPGLAANSLVAAGGLDPEPLVDPCGMGSELTIFDINETFPPPPNFPPDPTTLVFTGGSLAAAGSPGDSCTFSVVVDIPAGTRAGVYTNTTSDVTGELPGPTPTGGPPASGDLEVIAAPLLTKEFTDDPVLPGGGPVTLELTLLYDAEGTAPDATAIAFTDDLKTVLPGMPDLSAASVDGNTCGAVVDITNDPTVIDVSGGTLTAGESCVISLTLTVPAGAPIGDFTNTTSALTSTIGGVATTGNPASDDLVVTPLEFSKEFTDDPVIPGQPVTLVFTIENKGVSPADDASGILFFDSLADILPGTPEVTNPGPPSTNTCGGTESGSSTLLLYSGGSLAGGATCTVVYDLITPAGVADGDYPNVSSPLTATIGGGGVSLPPATDVLMLDSERLALSKEFTDDPVLPGGTVTLELTLENLGDDTITDIAFSDDLGAALSGLEAQSILSNTCGGSITLLPSPTIGFSAITLGPFASCTIEVEVEVPAAPLVGSPPYVNSTSTVTGKVGALDVSGGAASDELLVQLLSLEKAFTDDPTVAGGTVTLELTITNFGVDPVSDLAFSDDLAAALSGLAATVLPPAGICGAGSAMTGSTFLGFTGGSLPGNSFCVIPVTVAVPGTAPAGSFLNTTSQLFQSGLPVAVPGTDFLDIEPPPLFGKEFMPDTVDVGEVSTLTFTIDNGASAVAASALAFTDTLPAPVVVATPSGAATTCGGVVTAVSGSDKIDFSGGSVAAGDTCTVSVDVVGPDSGVFVNVSGELTSSSGNSGTASDTLTVVEADLELVKSDVFDPVMAGRTQIYTLTVTNLGPDTAKAVELTDVVPAGATLVVAEPTSSCSAAGSVVTCAAGDLAPAGVFTATITVYVELSGMSAPLDNLASVSSDTADPDLSNNDVMELTEVIPLAGVAALDDVDGNGFPEVAVPLEGSLDLLVKDVGTMTALHQTTVFPDGWALAGFEKVPAAAAGVPEGVAMMAVEVATGAAAVKVVAGLDGTVVSTAMVPAGFLPVAMVVIPDDNTMRSLIAVATVSLIGTQPRLFTFDAGDGSAVTDFLLHPGTWTTDLAPVASVPLVRLGIQWINMANGGKRLQVNELTGGVVFVQNLPKVMSPLALERLEDCCGVAGDELASLGWDRTLDRLRQRTVEALGGLVNDGDFGNRGQGIDIKVIEHFADSSADELINLFRNPKLRAAVRGRDAMTGANVLVKGYGPVGGSVPLGLSIAASVFDTAVDEVVVYWQDPVTGDRFVTLRDAGSGAPVAEMPIP